MNFSAVLPTFVITLREGVEAALVIGIVLAYLKKADQERLNPWVYSGVGVGIVASIVVGVLFTGLVLAVESVNQSYAPVVKPLLEGFFGLWAIALLSWMLIWMTRQSSSLKGEVEQSVTKALQKTDHAGWAVFGLTTIAVVQEGFEVALFINAQFQQGWMAVLGAIAGLVAAVAIGVMLFSLGIKINLRRFFQILGVMLLLIVSGLVVSVLRHLDAAGVNLVQVNPQFAPLCFSPGPSCILGPQIWDASQILPDRQFPGVLLKAFLGYTQKLYLAQAVGYVMFLGIIGSSYLKSAFNWQRLPLVGSQPPQNSTSSRSSQEELEKSNV
jgi:high-affinity iron transporter